MKKLNKLTRRVKLHYWLYMDAYVRPTLDQWLLLYKRWKYIHGIPSVKELFTPEAPSSHVESYQYYFGNVQMLAPVILEPHKVVWTKEGIGKVHKIHIDEDENIVDIEVEAMTRNYLKSKGYLRKFKVHELYQYVVFHKQIGKFILLSPNDYMYISSGDQQILYRVTKKGYARLSPKFRENLEYVRIFNEYRGGYSLLRKLERNGYIISKK